MRKASLDTDVLIIGGGLSGLTLAGLLGRAGVDTVVIDRDPPVSQMSEQYDARATALSFATKEILDAAGAWKALERQAAPIRDIRVADGASPLFLHFDENHSKGRPFGWNVENLLLRRALHDNVKSLKTVRHLAPAEARSFFVEGPRAGAVLKDGARVSASLMVGADGRGSAVRQWLGIESRTADYAQSAIVCTIAHTKDHESAATEHFLPAGPFAVLPLSKDKSGAFRSSVIWSVHGGDAKKILALAPSAFNARLQALCGAHLGSVRCVSRARSYPLSLLHAEKYAGARTALMAEAAHVIHPIAGQGLNVSMRDAALLADLVTSRLRLGLDIGAEQMLDEYARARRADTRLMTLFTDGLNRLFSNELKSAALARQAGLGLVQRTPLLKKFFARQAMGLGGARHKRASS
jgi:2-octaprenyl-6-methoxyphenol hydroxylase